MNTLFEYLQYSFVIYAIITGIFIALCSGVIGPIIVTKKVSFIGDGLSHVAFTATVIALITGVSHDLILSIPLTLIASIFLFNNKDNSKLPSDAILAVISIFGLSLGYMLMNICSKSSNVSGDVCGFLFGATSILTLNITKVISCIVLSILVVIVFILFYNRIYSVTFDETFFTASGFNTKLYKILIAVLIDIVIVLSMDLVGALLVSALLIIPALTAFTLTNSFKKTIILSTIVSIMGVLTGIIISILYGTPVGCTIVMVDTGILILVNLIQKIRRAL